MSFVFQCQTPFTYNDVIVLNGTDEDLTKLKEKMAVRVASRKSSKKNKVEKSGTFEVKTGPVEVKTEPTASTSTERPSTSNGIPSTSTSNTEIKKEKDEEPGPSDAVKKEIDTIPLSLPKFNPNKQTRGHFGSSKRAFPNGLEEDPSYKKTRKEYSVAKDPQSSEVYKSLFTSHQNDKEQKRAHWVTYNPFYN